MIAFLSDDNLGDSNLLFYSIVFEAFGNIHIAFTQLSLQLLMELWKRNIIQFEDHWTIIGFKHSQFVKTSDSYSETESKELKDMGMWLSCHQDVKYSTAPLIIAGRQFLWTHSIFELLYRNEFYSTIVRTSEQENVSL